jgi:hypothetical protein
VTDPPSDRGPHQLEYALAHQSRNHLLLLAVAAALILPVLLFYLWALEFVEEPPGGNGYMLEPEARHVVVVVIACVATVWVNALAYLLKRWLGPASAP